MLPPLFTADYLSRLETLRIQTRRRFLGSRPGGHVSLRRGAGLEFAEYRRYSPGDDLRYIDWNLYARTDRLYIKQFQEEEDLYTSLFLDGSASMAYPAQDGKSEAARDIILSLAHVVLASNDAVKLSLLGADTTPQRPRRSCVAASAWALLRNFSTITVRRVGSTSFNRWRGSCSSPAIRARRCGCLIFYFLCPMSAPD